MLSNQSTWLVEKSVCVHHFAFEKTVLGLRVKIVLALLSTHYCTIDVIISKLNNEKIVNTD